MIKKGVYMGMLDDVKSKKKQKAAENWMKMADTAKTIEKQIEYYTKSLDIDPYNAEAWFRKGRALEKVGRFEEAKKSFDLAIEIDPDYQGLIGRKYESAASAASTASTASPTPAATVSEDVGFVPEPPTPAATAEKEAEEQWITETPEPVAAEEIAAPQESEIEQESESSFRPPMGEESLFSNVLSGESDDNGSLSSVNDEEEEDVFGSSYEETAAVSEPEVISGGSDVADEKEEESSFFAASVPSETEEEAVEESEDTFSSAPVSEPEESPSSFGSDENLIRSREVTSAPEKVTTPEEVVPPKVEPERQTTAYDAIEYAEKPSIPGYGASSDAITGSMPVASAGVDIVDIRIPLNETIKFWAVGIVAMLIVLLISSLL